MRRIRRGFTIGVVVLVAAAVTGLGLAQATGSNDTPDDAPGLVGQRLKEGEEFTIRELFEALGEPLEQLPPEALALTTSVVIGEVKTVELQRVDNPELPLHDFLEEVIGERAGLLGVEEEQVTTYAELVQALDDVVEQLPVESFHILTPGGRRAGADAPLALQLKEGEEITLRELFEALGEPLEQLPPEALDAPLVIGEVETVELQVDDANRPFSTEEESITIYFYSYIQKVEGIIYGSWSHATAPLLYMDVLSELVGPTPHQSFDWAVDTTWVHAWNYVSEPDLGTYYTRGTHYWLDPWVYPPEGEVPTVSDPISYPY